MGALQMCGYLSAVIRAVLIITTPCCSLSFSHASPPTVPPCCLLASECEQLSVGLKECLLPSVTGDGADSEEIEIKYVLIGGGLGLFLAAGFIVVIICIIRKQIRDNSTDTGVSRPTEPHVLTLQRFSQLEPPVAAVSSDMEMLKVGQNDLQDDVNPAEVASG